EIQRMAQRHVAVAQSYLGALMEPAREIARRMKDPQQNLSDLPTARLLTLAARCASVIPNLMKAERLARGEPSSRDQKLAYGTTDVFQRIQVYAAAFEQILTHQVSTEGGGPA